MKMLHALNMSVRDPDTDPADTDLKDEEATDTSLAPPLCKGPFELDKHLSIFKSDSRFIIKRLDSVQGQHVEVSRWVEIILFVVFFVKLL